MIPGWSAELVPDLDHDLRAPADARDREHENRNADRAPMQQPDRGRRGIDDRIPTKMEPGYARAPLERAEQRRAR
jgi:hypothetical protein